MSASKEKNERQALYEAGKLDRDPQRTRHVTSRRWWIRLTCVLLAVLLVVGGALGLLASGFFANHTTAVTIGSYQLSPAEFSYFYWDAFYDYFNANQGDLRQVDQARTTMETAMYDAEKGISMQAHFTEIAMADAAKVYSIYDVAVSDGYALTELDHNYLNNQRSMMDVYAYSLELDDADAYVHKFYSRDCTVDGYLAYLTKRVTASGYADSKKESYVYTQEQLDAAYAASPVDYQCVSYKVYYVSRVIGKNDDGTVIADMQQSEQDAKRMAEACKNDLTRFNEMTVELASEKKKTNYEDPNFSLRTDDILGQATEPLRDWLADPARQYGDTTYVQADTSGYYVGFYLGRNDNDYPLPNLRVAQVSATADAKNTDDPDGMNAATETAQAILDQFLAGAQTADGFDQAALSAKEENASVSTSVQSPLVPSSTPGEVRDWCFDPVRRAGDVTLLPAAGGCYVLYFDGYAGRTYRDYLVDTKLRDADYKAWYESASMALRAQSHSLGMFFLRK